MSTADRIAAVILLAGLGLAPLHGQTGGDVIVPGGDYRGALDSGDRSATDKQAHDDWRLRAAPGERLSIVMESDDFDTQLEARLPDGTVLRNDDNHWIAETTDSRVDLVVPASGEIALRAGSFGAFETGDYVLRAVSTDSLVSATEGAAADLPIRLGQDLAGRLEAGETSAANGRHARDYRFAGRAGQRVDIRAASEDFDTRLALIGSDGFTIHNDDDPTAPPGTLDSRIVATLPATADYTIRVSTYGRGETGAYRVSLGEGPGDVADSRAAGSGAQTLSFGRPVAEMLGKNDETLASGEYLDRYVFEGRRGLPVTIDLSSEDFDSYLILRSPSGVQEDIDDTGESFDSRYARVLEEDGLYTILATSYAPGETGRYRLALEAGTERIPLNPAQRRVFAVSVGIADYGGNSSNLTNTDTDAAKLFEKLRELGVLHERSILLTNAQATLPEFRRAFRAAAAQAGPDDIFLLFFSGHGVQEEDPGDRAELDRRDELLVFADGEELRDDDLAAMFEEVRAGTSLLVLDACYSGGFERDVITRPGMMGLFSSEEDLTSLVASEFNAGGYLARFFSDAIAGRADDNDDGNVTAGELVSYLRYRFREQCNGRNCIEAETEDAQRNHQELVVQRGSVQVDDILVVLPDRFGVMR